MLLAFPGLRTRGSVACIVQARWLRLQATEFT